MDMGCLSTSLFFHFFCNALLFSVSFASVVKFTPKYFVIFDASVNGIVFSISLWGWSSLVYSNLANSHISSVFVHSGCYTILK